MIIACHECDQLHKKKHLPKGGVAKCIRCGAVLYRNRPNSLERTLALSLAGLVLFIIANTYPFLSMEIEGQMKQTSLITGVRELVAQDMHGLAFLVFFTSVFVPFTEIFSMLYILIPFRFNIVPWKLAAIFRSIRSLQPWGMMEVFMLGILVSLVKLAKMATIVPGLALYAFMALIFILAAMKSSLAPELVWERLPIDHQKG